MGRSFRMSLIELYKLPACNRRTVDNPDSVWDNDVTGYSFEKIVLENCMVQNIEKENLTVQAKGLSIDNTFTIFTDTPVYQAVDGSTFLGTSVYVPDSYFNIDDNAPAEYSLGGWFNVITPHHRRNGILEHSECILVKDTDPININGVDQYPSIAEIEETLKTKGGWKSNSWVSIWLSQP
ncbi:minor head protein [Vibrio phage 5P1c]